MEITKMSTTFFLVAMLTISFSNDNILAQPLIEQAALNYCPESCLPQYGNRKCSDDCINTYKYQGGQCDVKTPGATPQCCCYNYDELLLAPSSD